MNALYKNLLTIGFLVGFAVGGLAVWSVPFLIPRQNIYDKLRACQIRFSQGSWYEGNLKTAEYIQTLRNFEDFKSVYNEKESGLYSETNETVHVLVDPLLNVLWLVTSTDSVSIRYLGFYFYTESD